MLRRIRRGRPSPHPANPSFSPTVDAVVVTCTGPLLTRPPTGTYAQQSAVEEVVADVAAAGAAEDVEVGSKLRSLILQGDYFLVSALCNALTKLVLREAEIGVASAKQLNTSLAQVGLTDVTTSTARV